METGGGVERTRGKEAAGGLGQARWQVAERVIPHSCADKLGGTTGEADHATQGSSSGK